MENVIITGFTDGVYRVTGGLLNEVECLAWQPPRGRSLIWMCEVGRQHRKKVAGFILVRFADIQDRCQRMAQRAAITNSKDLAYALECLDRTGEVPAPENAWLGVTPRRDCKIHGGEPDLPPWALGYELVEEQEPYGCFAALGYCRRGEEQKFKVAKKYYTQLLCDVI